MPFKQECPVTKHGDKWWCQWTDERGKRRTKKGFATKGVAREWVDNEILRVEALRLGLPDPTVRT